jgi:hypothetical protein
MTQRWDHRPFGGGSVLPLRAFPAVQPVNPKARQRPHHQPPSRKITTMSDTSDTPISPDEEPTAEELAEASAIRPLEDLPSAWTVKGSPRMLEEPTLKALAPEDQQTVREAAGSNDPEAVKAALFSFLREKQTHARILYGAGEGASAAEREALNQMNQLRLHGEEYRRLEAELAAVGEARVETDANGDQFVVPVPKLQGSQRTWREARMREIGQAMSLLAGIEGEAGMERAAREEALKRRKVRAQIEERRAITRRAHEIASERRITKAAEAKAKFL